MEQWNSIHQRVLRDGVSIRQIQRETGFHHSTIRKMLEHSSPPAFSGGARCKPKLGPYLDRIASILQAEQDEGIPRKQRHTANPHISPDFYCDHAYHGISDTWLARRLRHVLTRCQPTNCVKRPIYPNLRSLVTKPGEICGLNVFSHVFARRVIAAATHK